MFISVTGEPPVSWQISKVLITNYFTYADFILIYLYYHIFCNNSYNKYHTYFYKIGSKTVEMSKYCATHTCIQKGHHMYFKTIPVLDHYGNLMHKWLQKYRYMKKNLSSLLHPIVLRKNVNRRKKSNNKKCSIK